MKTATHVDTQPMAKSDTEFAFVEPVNRSHIHPPKSFVLDKGNIGETINGNMESHVEFVTTPMKFSHGKWTDEEHKKLLEALSKFGNNWAKVSKYVGTRSRAQARSHTQKYFEKVKQDQLAKLMADPSQKKRIFLVTRQYLNRSFLNAKEINEFEVLPVQRKRKKTTDEQSTEKQNSGGPYNQTLVATPNLSPAMVPTNVNSGLSFPWRIPEPVPVPYVLPIPPALLSSLYQVNGNSGLLYVPYN